MIELLKRVLQESMQGTDGKFSSKKLTLFIFVCLVVIIHFVYLWQYFKCFFDGDNTESLRDLLMIDLVFMGGLLGINVFSNISLTKLNNPSVSDNKKEEGSVD
jgi:hypothetical protein